MNEFKAGFAAMQNNCILGIYGTSEEAISACREEIKKDWFSILCKKKLRKLFKKNRSNIALHKYAIFMISNYQEVNE